MNLFIIIFLFALMSPNVIKSIDTFLNYIKFSAGIIFLQLREGFLASTKGFTKNSRYCK